MALDFFGFEIRKKKDKIQDQGSVVSPTSDDGSTVVSGAAAYYGMVVDLEGVIKNENDLIRRYREVAQYSDCDSAIEDIINEAIIRDDDGRNIDIVLDDLSLIHI